MAGSVLKPYSEKATLSSHSGGRCWVHLAWALGPRTHGRAKAKQRGLQRPPRSRSQGVISCRHSSCCPPGVLAPRPGKPGDSESWRGPPQRGAALDAGRGWRPRRPLPFPTPQREARRPHPGLRTCLFIYLHTTVLKETFWPSRKGSGLAREGTAVQGPSAPGANLWLGSAPQLIPGVSRGWNQQSSAEKVSLPVPCSAFKATW